MKKLVIVKLDDNGNAIRQSPNNPEYGFIILSQERMNIDVNGWVNKKTFTALIKGEISDLKDSGIGDIKSLPGNIIVKESTTPFQDFNPNRDLKIAGDTGIILCTEDGEPIYRQTIYDGSGLMTDILIPHANGEEIKQVNKMNDFKPEKVKRKRRTKAEMEAVRALTETEVEVPEEFIEETVDDIEIEIEVEDNTIFDM